MLNLVSNLFKQIKFNNILLKNHYFNHQVYHLK